MKTEEDTYVCVSVSIALSIGVLGSVATRRGRLELDANRLSPDPARGAERLRMAVVDFRRFSLLLFRLLLLSDVLCVANSKSISDNLSSFLLAFNECDLESALCFFPRESKETQSGVRLMVFVITCTKTVIIVTVGSITS